MGKKCNHVADMNFAQMRVILGHTDESGFIRFSKEYAPMMRAVYCGFICKERYSCRAAKPHLPEEPDSDLELKVEPGICCDHADGLRSLTKQVIKKHLDRHKWFRHIKDKKAAIKDFMKSYEFIIDDMYCENACPYRKSCSTALDMKCNSETKMFGALDRSAFSGISEKSAAEHAY